MITSLDRHNIYYQQTMDDGRVRERNLLPSEKAFAGERARVAVLRCLCEELGDHLTADNIKVPCDFTMPGQQKTKFHTTSAWNSPNPFHILWVFSE